MMLRSLPEFYEMLINALEVRLENELRILSVNKKRVIRDHRSIVMDDERKKSLGNSKDTTSTEGYTSISITIMSQKM